MANSDITLQRLRELLCYDKDTGIFTWLVSLKGGAAKPGKEVLTKNDAGYCVVSLDGIRYKIHRLAWFYSHGVWPDGMIDHINGKRDDNALNNLRVATNAQNLQNIRRARSNNISSGVRGVTKHGDNWIAQIGHEGKQHYLGIYETIKEAQAAYLGAKRVLHPFGPV